MKYEEVKSIPRQKLFFSGFLLFLDGMARIRAYLSVPGWIRRTAPETKRAARNSTITPAILWPKDPARYLRILPVESIVDPPPVGGNYSERESAATCTVVLGNLEVRTEPKDEHARNFIPVAAPFDVPIF
jgi:hypothetical protein